MSSPPAPTGYNFGTSQAFMTKAYALHRDLQETKKKKDINELILQDDNLQKKIKKYTINN